MPPRMLSEDEYNTIKARVLESIPSGLSEDEFYRVAKPKMEQALGEAENMPATPEGSAAGRALTGAWNVLNQIGRAHV